MIDAVRLLSRYRERAPLARGTSNIPNSLFRYLLAQSGWHQVALVLLTIGAFHLEVVPLELQRRIVDDLTKQREFPLIVWLCAVYLGTVLVQGGAKCLVNVYRAWIGERATRDLRLQVHLWSARPASPHPPWRRRACRLQ